MIYFIQEGDSGPIKVGYSDEPETRRLTLQAGNPRPLRLLVAVSGTRTAERELHTRFAAGRLGGEWFAADAPELQEFVAAARLAPGQPELAGRKRHEWRKPPPRVLTADERQRIITAASELRDEVALRLILDYGVKRSELRALRVRDLGSLDVPHKEFWKLVEGLTAEPQEFLLYPRRRLAAGRGPDGERLYAYRSFPEQMASPQAAHRWWYRRLADAGIVEAGTTNGRGMRLGQLRPAPSATFTPRARFLP